MTVYEVIRNAVDIEEAAERYGMDVRQHKSCCPFHNDRTPSLGFKNGRFKCFGCGESGDVTDLVARLYGMTLHEAAERINADYNLRLDLDKPPDLAAVNAAKRRQALKAAWKEREIEITDAMFRYLQIRRMKEGWIDSTSQYVCDEWEYAKSDERVEIYAEWKGVIKKIERYVRENSG